MTHSQVAVRIHRESGYRFVVDFGPDMAALMVDEPPPLGEASGPSPQQLLAAAVANCLSASLTFALNKFREDPGEVVAEVRTVTDRNPQNRLRIQRVQVDLLMSAVAADLPHLERALAQFEEFCTVTMSVREGIQVDVAIRDGMGLRLR